MNKPLHKSSVQNPEGTKTLPKSKKPIQKKKAMNPADAEAVLERVSLSPAEREKQLKAMTGR